MHVISRWSPDPSLRKILPEKRDISHLILLKLVANVHVQYTYVCMDASQLTPWQTRPVCQGARGFVRGELTGMRMHT